MRRLLKRRLLKLSTGSFHAEDEKLMLGRLGAKLDGLRSIHYALPANGGKADDLTAAAVTANPFLTRRLAE